MRIAFISDGLFPLQIGGMQRHSTMLCNELNCLRGMDITVYAPGDKPKQLPSEIKFSPVFVSVRSSMYVKALWEYSSTINELVAEQKYDLIYCQGMGAVNIRNSAPVIYNPHGLEMFQTIGLDAWLKTVPLRWMARRCFSRASHIVCLGGKLRDVLMRAGCSQRKIIEEPNGINLSYIESFIANFKDVSPEPKRLFFVGRLEFNKGIVTLLRAFKAADDKEAKLVIGGAGSLQEDLTKEFGDDSRIEFLGALNEAELYRQFLLSEAFIFPSHFEGMPTVLMEAFACKRPVIATDIGAVRKIVKDNSGLLVRPNDESSLAQAIKSFLSFSDEKKKEMGLAGYTHVAENLDWPIIAKKSAEAFERIIKESRLK